MFLSISLVSITIEFTASLGCDNVTHVGMNMSIDPSLLNLSDTCTHAVGLMTPSPFHLRFNVVKAEPVHVTTPHDPAL